MSVRLAFTIVELIIVVAIIGIVLALAVPSFSAMVYSSDRALAANKLQATLQAARDLALRPGLGGDGAAAFVVEPDGRLLIVPAVQVGSFRDLAYPVASATGAAGLGLTVVERDVFVPLPNVEPAEMPRFWSVRGYAPPGLMVDRSVENDLLAEWYDTSVYGGDNPRAQGGSPDNNPKFDGNWVFPETAQYDVDLQTPAGDGPANVPNPRHSFMVRFEAGTGRLSFDPTPAVFLDPRPSSDRPYPDDPTEDESWKRIDLADDLGRWALGVLANPDPDGNGTPYEENVIGAGALIQSATGDLFERAVLLGAVSHDTVLVKAVQQLALYDDRELAAGLRASGLNRQTNSLYAPFARNERLEFDQTLFSDYDEAVLRRNINRWVAGDVAPAQDGPSDLLGDGELIFNEDEAGGDETLIDRPSSRVFTVQPYTGELVEIER
ncbi:MAG: prepilin-type N-terminal cleavage/methylation domain-containing protein [Planctomycetota bacterium]